MNMDNKRWIHEKSYEVAEAVIDHVLRPAHWSVYGQLPKTFDLAIFIRNVLSGGAPLIASEQEAAEETELRR